MWQIVYIKDGKIHIHDFKPATRDAAFGVGHELTRDFVADFFKVQRVNELPFA